MAQPDWSEVCECGHTRGYHWLRRPQVDGDIESMECGEDGCQCPAFVIQTENQE